MQQTVKERLEIFINSKKISKTDFGNIVGVSSAYITSMRSGIGNDVLQRIALNFPELNITWLTTGFGLMLNENKSIEENVKKSNEIIIPKEVLDTLSRMSETILLQQKMLMEQSHEIMSLTKGNAAGAKKGAVKGEARK